MRGSIGLEVVSKSSGGKASTVIRRAKSATKRVLKSPLLPVYYAVMAIGVLGTSQGTAEDRRPWAERDKYPPSGYSYVAESYYVIPPYVGPGSSVFVPPPVLVSRQPVIPTVPLYVDPFPNRAGGSWRGARGQGFQPTRNRGLPPSPDLIDGNSGFDGLQPMSVRPMQSSTFGARGSNQLGFVRDLRIDGAYRRPLSASQYAAQRRLTMPSYSFPGQRMGARNGW